MLNDKSPKDFAKYILQFADNDPKQALDHVKCIYTRYIVKDENKIFWKQVIEELEKNSDENTKTNL